MAGNFFQQQLDYVFFIYGLAFLLLGGACFSLIYSKDKKFPWLWLGLFGLIHGINEWLELYALSLGGSPLLTHIRLALLIVSFLFLVEFGRSSLFSLFKYPSRWIFVPLAIAAASGWILDKDAGLNITARYSLGFTGGLFTAFCVWRVSVKTDSSSAPLFKMISVILGLYAFTQTVVPKAAFFPASMINQDAFMKFLGLPVQIVRYLLAAFISALVWEYWIGIPLTLDALGLLKVKKKTVPAWVLVAICIVLSLAGWGVVYKAGVNHDRQEQKYMFETVSSIAAAINPERIKNLSGSSDDLTNPDYLRIREQIRLVHKALPGCRSIYLIGSRSRKAFFFINSDAISGDTDASFPGKISEEALKELDEIFSTGKALIDKPLIDKFSVWSSYYVPIKDLAAGEVLAVLGVDIDRIRRSGRILKERFKVILFAGVLWIVFIGSFTAFQISSLARQRIAFSEENLFLTVQNIADGVIATNKIGQIIRMNPVAERLTGWPLSEASGRDFSEVFCPVDMKTRHLLKNIVTQAAEYGKLVELAEDAIIIARNGTEKIVNGSAAPIRGKDGMIIGVVVVYRDITESEKAEEALRQSESKYKTLVEHLPQKVFLKDKNLVYISCNENYAKDLHIQPEEIAGKTDHDFFPTYLAEKYSADDKRVMKSGEIENIEEEFVALKDFLRGARNTIINTVKVPVRDKGGNVTGVFGIFWDITERKKAQEKIRLAAEEWEMTFNSIADLVFVQDKDLNIIRVNKSCAEALKMDPKDIIGRKCYELLHNLDHPWPGCPFEKTRQDGASHTEEVDDPHIGILLLVTVSPIFGAGGDFLGAVHVAKDITERKKAQKKIEEQAQKLRANLEELKRSQDILVQSEKMASLGRLASEIAHEINNPLMVISGNAQLSLMSESANTEVKNNLQVIVKECQKAKSITQRVLKFSKPSKGDVKEADINKSLEEPVNILEQQFGLANIEIRKEYGKDLAVISIDEQLMQEVFINIMNNAKDAMPEGGVITIKTFTEGDYLRIDFKDTGSGMSEEVKKRLLEPFFTTKEQGTGLGLSICYGIIKAHNGELKFESELKKGTTVTVLLPLGGRRAGKA